MVRPSGLAVLFAALLAGAPAGAQLPQFLPAPPPVDEAGPLPWEDNADGTVPGQDEEAAADPLSDDALPGNSPADPAPETGRTTRGLNFATPAPTPQPGRIETQDLAPLSPPLPEEDLAGDQPGNDPADGTEDGAEEDGLAAFPGAADPDLNGETPDADDPTRRFRRVPGYDAEDTTESPEYRLERRERPALPGSGAGGAGLAGVAGVPIELPPTNAYPSAELRHLDKMTGRTADAMLSVGVPTALDRLRVTVDSCRAPGDGALRGTMAHLTIVDSKTPEEPVFAGWMFADSPALSALDHARYDVWVIRCGSGGGDARADGRRVSSRAGAEPAADGSGAGGTVDLLDGDEETVVSELDAALHDLVPGDGAAAPQGGVPIPLPRPLF